MASSSNISAQIVSLQTSMDNLETLVQKVRVASDLITKRKEERTARTKVNQVKSEVNLFSTVAQNLSDAAQRSQYTVQARKYLDTLNRYDKELRCLISPPSASNSNTSNKNDEDDDLTAITGEGGKDGETFTNAKSVMQATNRGQDSINKSLKRSLQLGHTIRDQMHEMLGGVGGSNNKS